MAEDIGTNRDIVVRASLGDGFQNQDGPWEVSPDATPDQALEALKVIVKHIKDGEWRAVEQDNPNLIGVLRPKADRDPSQST